MANTRTELPIIQTPTQNGEPSPFSKVAVIGLGLIGGSIALATKKQWPQALVIGIDDKTVLEKAMLMHAIDVASDDPMLMTEADLVILAAPIKENHNVLASLEDHVGGEAVVTDVGSTKREICESSVKSLKRLRFVGGHPLGGAPKGGIENARPDLFSERPWLFTPTESTCDESLTKLRTFVTGFGAVPHVMKPDEHDRILASLSHLPQLVASALMHSVGSEVGTSGLALTGRGLSDTTRLASSPADIWKDIFSTNSDNVGAALNDFIETLEALREDLSRGVEIERVFASAGTWRNALLDERDKSRKQ